MKAEIEIQFRELREFIAKCRELAEVQFIDQEVDWNLEVRAMTRRCYELSAPAPLFGKIKDHPEGCRILRPLWLPLDD